MRFRAFALFLTSLAGCGSPASVASSSQAIVGGTGDVGDPGVVLVVLDQGNSASLCTGEVVSPHVIMTAAHCVDPSVVGTSGTYRVFTGLNVDNAKQSDFLSVKETHFNSKFDVNNLFGGNDIGVVILQNPTTISPLSMNRTAVSQTMVGGDVRLVGYGITSGSDTNGTTAGTKRQTTTKLHDFDNVLINFMDSQHLTCEGDSGGPAFMTVGGREVIVGITSFGDRTCQSMGADTRVDVYADSFVQPFIDQFDPRPKAALGNDCTDDIDCESKVCAHNGDDGYCTATCDPAAQTDSCSMGGLKCGDVDGANFCVKSSGGCDMTGEHASSAGLLLLSAGLLALVLRRRRN